VKDKWFAGDPAGKRDRAPDSRARELATVDSGLGRLLQAHDPGGIVAWARQNPRALSTLSSLLFETDDLLRWRAVEALGLAAAAKAERDPEPVRNLLRRLVFSLNEDSGMAGWHSPEAIGEILARVPALIDEYGLILVSFLHQSPFARGAHWAVARAAEVRPEAFRRSVGDLVASLSSADPYLRGFAAKALRALSWPAAKEPLQRLRDDPGALRQYDFKSGELQETTVGKLAQTALLTLDPP